MRFWTCFLDLVPQERKTDVTGKIWPVFFNKSTQRLVDKDAKGHYEKKKFVIVCIQVVKSYSLEAS